MSTGSAGRPRANINTQAAVFGPTPGSDRSHAFASASGISPRNERPNDPRRCHTSSRIALMRPDLVGASPPTWISLSISPGSAAISASHVGKRDRRRMNARPELASEVF